MEEIIKNLGDIAELIDTYFKENKFVGGPDDSWNPLGFSPEHINSDFGWNISGLKKPSIDDLIALWKRTKWNADEWNKMSILERIKSEYFDVSP